jgi:osmotically-inducible protein OsmY
MKRIFHTLFVAIFLTTGCVHHPHKKVTANLLDEKVVAERVKLALQKDGAGNFENIRIGVAADGMVTLQGTDRTAREKIRAGEIAQQVEQVSTVNNQLIIGSVNRQGKPTALPRGN